MYLVLSAFYLYVFANITFISLLVKVAEHSFGSLWFLKPLYANLVWITKNNVKANIWKLYMKFGANKEFMENLSSHFTAVIVKCMKNNVDITKPRYSGFTVKSPESHLTRSYVARQGRI